MALSLPTCRCVLCADPGDHGRFRRWYEETKGHVRDHGWSTLGILPGRATPGWAFSVGLWHSYRSPEVAIFGLLLPHMQQWINRVGRQIRDGKVLLPDAERDGVLDDVPVIAKQVHPGWYSDLFGSAIGFYQGVVPPFYQLVWPDSHGMFPWEPGCGERCRTVQPRLWLAPEEHPEGAWRQLR